MVRGELMMMHLRSKDGKRSRKSRRVTAAKLPRSLRKVNLNAAGIDVGATEHYVAVPEGCDEDIVRSFGTYTADLEALADWFKKCDIQTVAMESTGVYWIPVFEILESRGFEVKLVEPGKLKNVPGRKTDVLDCQWIQQLHTYGLLQGSFVPIESICILRSYMRQRSMLIECAGKHVLHMQKALMQMNIQLHHVISDITGATGQRIIGAILEGERDPKKLSKLRDPRCKKDEHTIALALEGHWREDHLFVLKQAVQLYHFYHTQLEELDKKLQDYLKTFEDRSKGRKLPASPKPKAGSNAPNFDMRNHLYKMSGVDLTTIDGISGHSALQLISEIGIDMNPWPTEKHFASWLCLCPGNKKTGGRLVSGKSRASANRAATVLRMAAQSLSRADCALGAFYRRMKSRLGAPKAITATAHKLAKIVYNMLKYGKAYIDVGAEYYEKRFRQRVLANLTRRASQFKLRLVPVEE
jgi:transposase